MNRIHFAFDEETRSAVSAESNSPEIQAALNEWREINQDPRKWATIVVQRFASGHIVKVKWGTIHTDGTKEYAIQTITYNLQKDGTVVRTKHTHC